MKPNCSLFTVCIKAGGEADLAHGLWFADSRFVQMICLENSSLLRDGAKAPGWSYTGTILSKLNGLLMFMNFVTLGF